MGNGDAGIYGCGTAGEVTAAAAVAATLVATVDGAAGSPEPAYPQGRGRRTPAGVRRSQVVA